MDVAPRIQNSKLGIILLCSGVAFFSVGEACVKALAKDYDILQVVWARYLFHALVFVLIFSRSGIVNQMKTSRPILHIARSIVLMLGTITFFTALIYLSMPEAVAINFAAPLLVTALSIPILGEKVGLRRWVAILIGFVIGFKSSSPSKEKKNNRIGSLSSIISLLLLLWFLCYLLPTQVLMMQQVWDTEVLLR